MYRASLAPTGIRFFAHGSIPGSVNRISPLMALVVSVAASLLAILFHIIICTLWEHGACNNLIGFLGATADQY